MLQLLLFCLALCAGTYGALSGSLPSLLTATAATLLAATSLFSHPARQTNTQQALIKSFERYNWLILCVLAIFFAGLAARQALTNVFDFKSGYLWLIGLFLVGSAGYFYDYTLKQRTALEQVEGAQTLKPALIFDRIDWLSVGVLTAVALLLRLYRLSDFLPTMHGDEGEMGMLALLALRGPASGISPMPLPLFSTAFLDHPTLFHYLQAAAMWLFGESLYGLRTLSAIFGALCVPVVYGIGRLGWGRIAGIAAGWLLAVSHFHLQYSRIALNNIETVCLTALFICLMMFAAEKTQWTPKKANEHEAEDRGDSRYKQQLVAPVTPYLWAGLTMGLSQYFYYGSRLMPVLAAPLLLLLWLKRRLTFAQVAMLIAATVVAYAPMAGFYWQHWQTFLNRTQGVSIISPGGMAHTLGPQAVWPDDIPRLLLEQVKRNIAFFVRDGDRSSFYLADVGAFDPITVALFWLGLGVVLARLWRFHEFAILLWFGLGFILAGVITNDAPNGPRLVVMTTTVYIIGGILLQRLFNFSQRIWPRGSQWGTLLVGICLAVGTLQSNFTTYFDAYAGYSPNLMPISMAHDIRDVGADYQIYIFGAPLFYAEYGVLRFVAHDVERNNGETAEQLPSLAEVEAEGQGLMVIVLPHRLADLDQVIARFPGGVQEERKNPAGNLLYVIYRLPGSVASHNTGPASSPNQQSNAFRSPVSPLLPTVAGHPPP